MDSKHRGAHDEEQYDPDIMAHVDNCVVLSSPAALEADAKWRHRWHQRLGRGPAEPEGRFYARLEASLSGRQE